MANTEKRKNYNTPLDKSLIRKLKIVAADNQKNQNEVLEEAIRHAIRDIASGNLNIPDREADRKNKNTTINRELIHELNKIKARTDLPHNIIIEYGLRKIFKKYSSTRYTGNDARR